jgi:hypothetical protein
MNSGKRLVVDTKDFAEDYICESEALPGQNADRDIQSPDWLILADNRPRQWCLRSSFDSGWILIGKAPKPGLRKVAARSNLPAQPPNTCSPAGLDQEA